MSLNQLPLEIWLAIFYFLDIPDIIRTRRVSWYLNHVGHHRDIWADAYRRAEFICPPGPFPSQTAYDLENALVPSFRVDRCLRHRSSTAQSKRSMPKLREIRFTGRALHVGLVFGRFLLVALHDQVRCYDPDLDPFGCDSDISVIYEPAGKYLKSFRCVSAIDTKGHRFACVVLTEAEEGMRAQISIYSLNVDERCKVTLDLLHRSEQSEFNICSVDLGPRVIVVQGTLGNSSQDWHTIVFDVHARTQFLLTPSGGPGADDMLNWVPVCAASYFSTIPSVIHPLEISSSHFTPIRARSIFSGIATFRLSKSHHDEVGAITLQLSHSLDHHLRIRAFYPTLNGTGRMFYMRTPGLYGTLAALEYDVRGGDNANGEPVAKTMEHTILHFPAPRSILDYDPYSGRVCLRFDGRSDGVVEIMDLM